MNDDEDDHGGREEEHGHPAALALPHLVHPTHTSCCTPNRTYPSFDHTYPTALRHTGQKDADLSVFLTPAELADQHLSRFVIDWRHPGIVRQRYRWYDHRYRVQLMSRDFWN